MVRGCVSVTDVSVHCGLEELDTKVNKNLTTHRWVMQPNQGVKESRIAVNFNKI